MIIFVDMDDVLCDYSGAHNRDLKSNPGIKYPQSQYGFFTNLEPLDNAIVSVKTLIKSKQYEPYILTAPSTRNPLSYTEKRVWVQAHLGYSFVERLIICAHKNLLKGDYLIDDNIEGKGQEAFEGELIHFGSKAYPNWQTVMAKLGL